MISFFTLLPLQHCRVNILRGNNERRSHATRNSTETCPLGRNRNFFLWLNTHHTLANLFALYVCENSCDRTRNSHFFFLILSTQKTDDRKTKYSTDNGRCACCVLFGAFMFSKCRHAKQISMCTSFAVQHHVFRSRIR